MLVCRGEDREFLRMIARTRREVRTAPLVEPGPGEYVDRCSWSRTGYAIHKSKGHCTCEPALPEH